MKALLDASRLIITKRLLTLHKACNLVCVKLLLSVNCKSENWFLLLTNGQNLFFASFPKLEEELKYAVVMAMIHFLRLSNLYSLDLSI